MRRKGERKLTRQWPAYAVATVQRAINEGDGWFDAWARQAATTYPVMARKAGIPFDRLLEISRGAPITRDELGALCRLWNVEPEKVVSTMPIGAIAE